METKTDMKTLGAGAGLGGGLATIIVSLLMNNMGANTKALQAENQITMEMVRQNTLRLERNEERYQKKSDQFEGKMDKILELVQSGTRDRFTKLDQEKHVVKIEARLDRIEDRVNNINNELNSLEQKIKTKEK